MAFAYLDDDTLDAVKAAATGLGFGTDGQFAAATSRVSPAFVGTFAAGGNTQARLTTLIHKMNETRMLVSGEVPLRAFLRTGIDLAGGREEELVFRLALEKMSADGAAQPASPAGPAPPVQEPGDVLALPASHGALEIQIEEDDTLDVAFLLDGSVASRSVAQLAVHRHFGGAPMFVAGGQPDVALGTGWLIGPGLVITNHHVVGARAPLEPAADATDFALQGQHTKVVFDFHGAKPATVEVASVACEASDPTLDYAILRVAGGVEDRAPLRLRPNPITKQQAQALRERVNVLQHPDGKPMRLGFRDNWVVTGSEEKLSYLTDTAGGSSGAPIFDDAWFVAALHRGWQTISGQPVQVWGKAIKQENYGTPIGRILDHLAANHPALRAEIGGP
jgi:endonuclease G, mitochondrial